MKGIKGFFSLDIDGAMVRNTFVNGVSRPNEGLLEILRMANRAGYHIVLNTGQTYEVASQFREFLEIPNCWVMVEMGNILHKNCVGETVLQGEALNAFNRRKEELIQNIITTGGKVVTDTKLMLVGAYTSVDKLRRIAEEVPSCDIAKIYPVYIDVRLNVLPKKTDKGVITNFIDAPLIIAAGDSTSDIPMMEKAVFPIATHESGEAHPKLIELIEKKGRGYIAKSNEPTGFGMLKGIQAAIKEGIISL